MGKLSSTLTITLLIAVNTLSGPKTVEAQAQSPRSEIVMEAVEGFTLREIGPAVMGGRIADIAVHPHKSSTWYLAVGSGGVWKF